MPNANKQKGDRWELSLVHLIKEWFPDVARRKAGWAQDMGDLSGIPNLCVECKDTAPSAIGSSMDKALVSWENTKQQYMVMFQKRRGKPVEDGYAVMPISNWLELYKRVTELEGKIEIDT